MSYLRNTGSLSEDVKQKATQSVLRFYTELMTKKTSDNSWILPDFAGSIESTAFVAKFLSIAKTTIEIDAGHITSAISYITAKQNSTGSFSETRNLKDEITLTAFVAIAIYENTNYVAANKNSLKSAIKFINDKFNTIEDPFSLAISAYALSFDDMENSKKFSEKLIAMSSVDGDEMKWKSPKPVQTSVYALLTMSIIGKNVESYKIMKGLHAMQNSNDGGFGSTLSTVLAYQAAAELAKHFYSNENNLKIVLTPDNTAKISFNINNSNAKDFKYVIVPDKGVSFNLEGTGIALFQIVQRFRLEDNEKDKETEKMYKACYGDIPATTTESSASKTTDGPAPKSTWWIYAIIGAAVAAILGVVSGIIYRKKKGSNENELPNLAFKRVSTEE